MLLFLFFFIGIEGCLRCSKDTIDETSISNASCGSEANVPCEVTFIPPFFFDKIISNIQVIRFHKCSMKTVPWQAVLGHKKWETFDIKRCPLGCDCTNFYMADYVHEFGLNLPSNYLSICHDSFDQCEAGSLNTVPSIVEVSNDGAFRIEVSLQAAVYKNMDIGNRYRVGLFKSSHRVLQTVLQIFAVEYARVPGSRERGQGGAHSQQF